MHTELEDEQKRLAIQLMRKTIAVLDLKSIVELNGIRLNNEEYKDCLLQAVSIFIVDKIGADNGTHIVETIEYALDEAEIRSQVII